MKVNEAISHFLHDNGISTIFGVLGDANMFYVEHFVRTFGGKYVAAAHEAGATLMAIGYASVSGEIGVASVTQGPALANAIPALLEGVRARIPIVLIAGDISTSKTHLQSLAQRELVLASGAGFELARSPATACRDLHTSFRRAYVEQRPIVFNLPTDYQWTDTSYAKLPLNLRHRHSKVADSPDLEDAVGIIASAKRPVVVAGRGASSSAAREALIEFASRIGAPLLTTLKAKDLFRGEANSLGVMGTISSPETIEMLLKSDCIVAFGASLTGNTTSKGSLVEGKRVVLVNDDPADLDNHHLLTAGVIGDTASTAARFVYWLDEAEIPSSGFVDEDIVTQAREAYEKQPAAPLDDIECDVPSVLDFINEKFPADRLFITDGGRYLGEAWRRVSTPGPQFFVLGHNSGAIGLGVPHAIGAAVADHSKPALLISGDGGFMMGGLAEFNTAVRYKLDLTIVIFNDGSYGSEHIQFRDRGMDASIANFNWPDFAPLAEALGGRGFTVRTLSDLAAVERAWANRDKPILVDVKMDPNKMPAPPW